MSSTVSRRHHVAAAQSDFDADTALLELLTGPVPTVKSTFARRDAALDPLLIAAAVASGPHITRNHYHHDFFPGVALPQSESSWDWTKWTGEDTSIRSGRKRLTYVSRQAPRRQRLQDSTLMDGKENDQPRETDPLKLADNLPPASKKRRPSLVSPTTSGFSDGKTCSKPSSISDLIPPQKPVSVAVEVKCMARTRIPTPHGPVFLHLYHNNRDDKEHLAIVVDPAQLSENPGSISAPPIRSRSLDAVWGEDETEMDRIVRGAYVGRLSPSSQHASGQQSRQQGVTDGIPSPLIRIHSECFTGETVGSMRCDCGEQLDEAIRRISQPITIPSTSPLSEPATIPGRGAVIYLRQEGRGIGLLSKIRAYNLQDLGHDTVTANIMLGYKADERGYEIAVAILRDLGLGGDADSGADQGVRVLTNNPDKVEALQKEGLHVIEHLPMIPRSWQCRQPKPLSEREEVVSSTALRQEKVEWDRTAGVALNGGTTVYGEDLDKYLRTKVLRMGHMLPLWMEDSEVS